MKKILLLLLAVLLLAGCEAVPEATEPTALPTLPPETAPAATEPAGLPPVSITEVMADNTKLCLGHESDWVELYNAGETPVDLEGWYLTDDPLGGIWMPLAGMILPAEDYLVVTMDGTFGLSSKGETVYLLYRDWEADQLTYGEAPDGLTYDRNDPCTWPTPGFPNTEAGYESYQASLQLPELVITEVLASNSKYLRVGQEYYDMVEILNNSREPLNLADYGLTDKANNPTRYTFPEVTLQPGETDGARWASFEKVHEMIREGKICKVIANQFLRQEQDLRNLCDSL